MERPEWTTSAKQVEPVNVDVGFLVSETFYHGPENGFSQEQWRQLREPLYQPKVERYGDYLLSAEFQDSAIELVRYYQDVLRLGARHKKVLKQQSHYFWIRPLIFQKDEFAITFPWYDTWQEAVAVLDALEGTSDGLVFDDLEQGWDVQVFAEGDFLFLRQGDFDSGEEHIVIATHRARLASQVPAVRARVIHLLAELTGALGRDYWSRRW
jgi:hypothetical protein